MGETLHKSVRFFYLGLAQPRVTEQFIRIVLEGWEALVRVMEHLKFRVTAAAEPGSIQAYLRDEHGFELITTVL